MLKWKWSSVDAMISREIEKYIGRGTSSDN